MTNLRLGLSLTDSPLAENCMQSWSTERAWMSLTRLDVVSATNKTVLRLRALSSEVAIGSKGGSQRPLRTTGRSQEGKIGLFTAVCLCTPFRKKDHQFVLTNGLAVEAGVVD